MTDLTPNNPQPISSFKAIDELMDWFSKGQDDAETAVCSKHGEYKLWGNNQSCPTCEREQAEKQARYEKGVRLLEHCGLTPVEQEARFKNYQPVCQQASDIKEALAQYDFTGHLILSGRVGTGKTHLACALVRKACFSGLSAKFITLGGYFRELRQAQRFDYSETELSVVSKYARAEFLVIDEVAEFDNPKEAKQFSELMVERYRNRLPTCLITNLSFPDLARVIEARILDRFGHDIGVYLFDWDSYRRPINQSK